MLQGFSGIQNLNGSLLVYPIQYAHFNVIFYWKNKCKIKFSELNLLKCKILNKMNFLTEKKKCYVVFIQIKELGQKINTLNQQM